MGMKLGNLGKYLPEKAPAHLAQIPIPYSRIRSLQSLAHRLEYEEFARSVAGISTARFDSRLARALHINLVLHKNTSFCTKRVGPGGGYCAKPVKRLGV